MSKLYDTQIDLSTSSGSLPRDAFKDGMRVRCHGHSENRQLLIPAVVGQAIFKNDGDGSVILKRGAAVPLTVGPGQAMMVLFDETEMTRVG